jgi:hypothetical protein
MPQGFPKDSLTLSSPFTTNYPPCIRHLLLRNGRVFGGMLTVFAFTALALAVDARRRQAFEIRRVRAREALLNGGIRCGHIPPGSPAFAAHDAAQPGIHHRGRCRAGPRYRGKYRNLFCRQHGSAAAPALPRPEPPGAVSQHVAAGIGTRSVPNKVQQLAQADRRFPGRVGVSV